MATSSDRGRGLGLAGLVAIVACGLGFWAYRATREPDELERGRAAYAKGRWGEAASRAVGRLLKVRDDPEAARLLARATARSGQDASALSLYAKVAADRMEAEDLYLKGVALGGVGNAQGGLEALEAALKAEPDHAEALEVLGQVYSSRHEPEKAAEVAARLARRPGHEASGNLMLGVLRSDLNDVGGAIEALGRGIGGNASAPPGFRKLYARSLLRAGRPDEARRQLEGVLGLGEDSEASWLLGRAGLQSGRLAEASAALERSGPYLASNPQPAEPSPYVGERQCAGCHAGIAGKANETRHARTFHRGAELLKLPVPDAPLADPGDPAIAHAIRREGGQVRQSTRAGDRTYELIVDYAFGTPERYLTMVGREGDGTARALRMSYHRSGKDVGWDLTSGDSPKPDDPGGHRGKPIATREGVIRCLACHTTNVRIGEQKAGPESADRGIGCEQCHGPGGNHVLAVAAKWADPAILRPDAARSCVACHTLNDDLSEQVTPRDDPAWVRSPGKALTWSRCFVEGAGKLSCLTCHDPHADADPSPASYAAKCLTCHEPTASASSASGRPCPVNPRADCVSCHMPPVRNELLHTSLTDHYIRIHPKAPAE